MRAHLSLLLQPQQALDPSRRLRSNLQPAVQDPNFLAMLSKGFKQFRQPAELVG